MSAKDLRAHPRFPLILAVDYPGAAASVRDYTENLSAGGLFIRTERRFEVGDRVTLLVSFPELLEPAELQVEVVRVRSAADEPPGVAVWVPPDRVEDRRALEQLTLAAAEAAERSHPSYRVLLVEDNSLVAAMYTSALRRLSSTEGIAGMAVEVAGDGNEAFARMLAMPPIDLVITDVYMPILSGFGLVEKIRAEPRLARTPIVVISSGGTEERERLNRLGANFFLQKPVKYQDIVATVRALLSVPGHSSSLPRPGKGESQKPRAIDLVGGVLRAELDKPAPTGHEKE